MIAVKKIKNDGEPSGEPSDRDLRFELHRHVARLRLPLLLPPKRATSQISIEQEHHRVPVVRPNGPLETLEETIAQLEELDCATQPGRTGLGPQSEAGYAESVAKTAKLREALQWGGEEWQDAYDQFISGPSQIDLLVVLKAQTDNRALSTMEQKALNILTSLRELAARNRNVDAIQVLANLGAVAAEALWDLAKENPDIVRRVARKNDFWPIRFCPHPCIQKALNAVTDGLEVGFDRPLLNDKGARSKRMDDVGKFAENLWRCVADCRALVQTHVNDPALARLPDWAKKAADLPPFSKDTSDIWWAVAYALLLSRCPKPERNPAFIPWLKGHMVKRRPSERREVIRSKLKSRFKGMAPK